MYKRYLHKYFLNFIIPIDEAMIGAVPPAVPCFGAARGAASRCLCQTLVSRSAIIDQASVPDLN